MQPQDLYYEVQMGADIKDFLFYLHAKNTGEVMLRDTDKLEALPTLLMSAIPPHSAIVTILPHQLYLDWEGRQCLKLDDLLADTVDLVDEAVNRFYDCTGTYPDEIVLCPSRYILLQFGHFCPVGGILIPFVRDFVFPIDYDVIVRRRYVL
jgi:hypothetical protein